MHYGRQIILTLIHDVDLSSKAVGAGSARLDLIGPRRWAGAHMDRAGALPTWPTSLWSGLVSSGVF
jgi:hypothetical protein